jgi:hypothetical protein
MTLNSPTTLTEIRRPGEFIVSEGNGTVSRDVGTLQIGHVVADGTVVKVVTETEGDVLAPLTADDFDTEGVATEVTIAGVLIGHHDSSATGANAAIPGLPYIARSAEVDSSLLVLFSGSSAQDLADVIAVLKTEHVVAR